MVFATLVLPLRLALEPKMGSTAHLHLGSNYCPSVSGDKCTDQSEPRENVTLYCDLTCNKLDPFDLTHSVCGWWTGRHSLTVSLEIEIRALSMRKLSKNIVQVDCHSLFLPISLVAVVNVFRHQPDIYGG